MFQPATDEGRLANVVSGGERSSRSDHVGFRGCRAEVPTCDRETGVRPLAPDARPSLLSSCLTVAPTLTFVKRSMVERKLLENGDELKRAREELRVSTEQLEQLANEADEARLRSLVSETPLSEQSFHEASRHAEAMRRHHTEVQTRISDLETRQDQLLDQMSAS